MADTIRRVSYYYTTIPDKPGEGTRLLDALRRAGVNLLALHAFPSARKAQVDFVPSDAAVFEAAAKGAKIKLSKPKAAFLVDGHAPDGDAAVPHDPGGELDAAHSAVQLLTRGVLQHDEERQRRHGAGLGAKQKPPDSAWSATRLLHAVPLHLPAGESRADEFDLRVQ